MTLLWVTYANLLDFRVGRNGISYQYWLSVYSICVLTLKEEVEVAEYPLVADVRESMEPCLLKLDSEP